MIFLFVLNSFLALASPELCPPLGEVTKQVSSCADNRRFTQAAHLCLQRLNSAIGAQRVIVALLAAKNGADPASQAAELSKNAASLAQAEEALESLIRLAVRAKADVIAFGNHFTMPGSFSADALEKLGLSRLFFSFPCFTDNQVSLANTVDDLEKRIAELTRASASVSALGRASRSKAGSLGEISSGAAGLAARLSARKVQPESTVTGAIRGDSLVTNPGAVKAAGQAEAAVAFASGDRAGRGSSGTSPAPRPVASAGISAANFGTLTALPVTTGSDAEDSGGSASLVHDLLAQPDSARAAAVGTAGTEGGVTVGAASPNALAAVTDTELSAGNLPNDDLFARAHRAHERARASGMVH